MGWLSSVAGRISVVVTASLAVGLVPALPLADTWPQFRGSSAGPFRRNRRRRRR